MDEKERKIRTITKEIKQRKAKLRALSSYEVQGLFYKYVQMENLGKYQSIIKDK